MSESITTKIKEDLIKKVIESDLKKNLIEDITGIIKKELEDLDIINTLSKCIINSVDWVSFQSCMKDKLIHHE
jgi:hypothetical protein